MHHPGCQSQMNVFCLELKHQNPEIQSDLFLGWWKRDASKGLSDLQLGDEKITLNHLEYETKTMDGGLSRA